MTFLSRHSLLIGVLLMYALTWPVYFLAGGILPLRLPRPSTAMRTRALRSRPSS